MAAWAEDSLLPFRRKTSYNLQIWSWASLRPSVGGGGVSGKRPSIGNYRGLGQFVVAHDSAMMQIARPTEIATD
jgi:hypothetical protein